MPFAEIFGHDKPLAILRKAQEKDRLPHAYLFLGPEGVGKKTVALAFASAIQCRRGRNDFCGQCASCVQVSSRNHPDVRLLAPAAGKKEISIRQVRELEKELSFRPFSGRKKIAIVDPAVLLNAPAQNALLKTLEEPPAGSLIILIAASPGGLLPTLVSRCQRLNFSPLPLEVAANFLVAQRGVDRAQAELLAALAVGNPGKALSPELGLLVEQRRTWLEKMSSLTPSNYQAALAAAEQLAAEKDECLRFLEWAEGWYRDLMVCAVQGGKQQLMNRDLGDELGRHATQFDLERVLRLRAGAVQTAARIRRNVNRRLALEHFFLGAVGTR